MPIAALIAFSVSIAVTASDTGRNSPDQTTDVSEMAKACAFSIHALDASGKPLPPPLIEPRDVATIVPAEEYFPGEKAMFVTLTVDGGKRMLQQTQDRVGSTVVAYCGTKKISTIRLMGPVSGPFRVSIDDQPGT